MSHITKEHRYKIYLILALMLCALGVLINSSTGNVTGVGVILIMAGGISLVMGITLKRKVQDEKEKISKNSS